MKRKWAVLPFPRAVYLLDCRKQSSMGEMGGGEVKCYLMLFWAEQYLLSQSNLHQESAKGGVVHRCIRQSELVQRRGTEQQRRKLELGAFSGSPCQYLGTPSSSSCKVAHGMWPLKRKKRHGSVALNSL